MKLTATEIDDAFRHPPLSAGHPPRELVDAVEQVGIRLDADFMLALDLSNKQSVAMPAVWLFAGREGLTGPAALHRLERYCASRKAMDQLIHEAATSIASEPGTYWSVRKAQDHWRSFRVASPPDSSTSPVPIPPR